MWVSLEGGVAGGKTTFIDKVLRHLDVRHCVIPEPVEEWEANGILKRSYVDPNFKFAAQCVFFTSRIRKFRELYDPTVSLHISERSPFSDKIFWNVNCDDDEELHAAYMDMWKEWQQLLPVRRPSLFIYLKTSVDTCMARMAERNREAESGVPREYQAKLIAEHERIFCEGNVQMPDGSTVPCLVLDGELNYRDDEAVAKQMAQFISDALKDQRP
jgi:deoxyadenosine/deoxycytidine kinase